MARSRVKVWITLFLVPALLVVGAISYLAWRQRVPGVQAEFTPVPKFIGLKTPLTLDLRASRGGVQSVDIHVIQGTSRVPLAQQTFSGTPADEQRVQLTVGGRELGLREGAATVEVRARDGYWRPIGNNEGLVSSVPVMIDLTPPSLEVLAATRYIHQGGGGLAAIRVKGATRVGVKVGERFFPAFRVGDPESGLATALFAIPWNLADRVTINATAEDEAGNGVARPVPAEMKPRRFPTDTIELTDRFLASKVPELLPERGQIPPDQLLAAFLTVNREKRQEAEETKRRLGARTQPRPVWEGPFIQPRNTKVFSNFAETRSYRYHGKEVDTQVHLGFDLASVKHGPAPAANSGVVAFAGPLTIYGNTVVLDHGLGLQTLYGHLSSISVKEGEEVKKGQELGRTGTSGLAVGDHLHFEVLINGISVTPVEWWDGRWIRDHVGLPLREANIPLLQSEFPAGDGQQEPATPAKKRRLARAR